MRFSYKFDRVVAAGGVTTLGTDAVPTSSAYLSNTNVFKTKLSASEPSQRICLAAKYTGADVPVAMTAKAYIYDGVSQSWFTVDSYSATLKCGDICFFGIPQIISPAQVSGGDEYASTVDSIEWALVVDCPVGCPDGTFEFLLGLDISEVEDEIQAGHVEHVILDSPNPLPVEGATAVGSVPDVATKPLDLGAVVLDADPAAATDTKIGRFRLDSLYRLIVRAYMWSFTKGASTAAGVTSTAHGADHQALDTTPYGATAVGSAPAAATKPMDMGAVILDADPAAGTDGQMGRMRLDSLFRLIVRSYNWASAKGASTAMAITGIAVGPNRNALDIWDNSPQTHMSNYSCSRGDAPAPTWASGTTMTWNGPTLASWQLRKVMVITDASTRPLVWEQGANAVLTISGTTITVNALDGTVAPLTGSAPTFIDVMWTAQDKAFDAGLQAERVAPVYSDAMRNYPQDCSQTTSVAGGVVTPFYIPGDAITNFSIQWYSSAGSYAKTLKVYATDQDDSSVALGSLNFNDVTADWFGAATINCAAGTVTSVWWGGKNTPTTCKWIRIDVTTAAGATVDNQWVIYTRRAY